MLLALGTGPPWLQVMGPGRLLVWQPGPSSRTAPSEGPQALYEGINRRKLKRDLVNTRSRPLDSFGNAVAEVFNRNS
jgi:hypothetical protein